MELKDLNKLRFSCEVLYNNTICKVYGLCGPMPNEDPYYNNKATVTLWCNGLITVTLDDVEPYKEETMEEIKIDIPKGYEFAGVDDNKQQVVFTKIQPQYPKTYEECCMIIGFSSNTFKWDNPFCINRDTHPYIKNLDNLIESFYKLLICRDAYWKIAGEQMGLNKPWEPDWTNLDQMKYCIWVDIGEFITTINVRGQHILAFPTEEMRDTFFENFKDLIEQCKELL